MTTAREALYLGSAFEDEKARAEFPKGAEVRLQQLRVRCFELATQPNFEYVKGGISPVAFADKIFRWVTTGELDKPTET